MDLFDIVISGKIRKEGGGDVSVDALNVTENGVYTASSGHAYSPVTVAVPQPSGTLSITSNGVFDVGSFASADVNVGGGGGGDEVAVGLLAGTLSSLTVPSGVSSIRQYACYGCNSMSTLIVPDGVTQIGGSAFTACTALKSIDLPSTLTYIGKTAFQNAGAVLLTVTCRAVAPPSLGTNALAFGNAIKNLYVPAESIEDYKSAYGWSSYSSKIQAIA